MPSLARTGHHCFTGTSMSDSPNANQFKDGEWEKIPHKAMWGPHKMTMQEYAVWALSMLAQNCPPKFAALVGQTKASPTRENLGRIMGIDGLSWITDIRTNLRCKGW